MRFVSFCSMSLVRTLLLIAIMTVLAAAFCRPSSAQEADTATSAAQAISEETAADSSESTFAKTVNSSFSGIFQLGMDVLYTAVKGEVGSLALGAGADFAKFSKPLGSGGNSLDVYLHGTLGAYTTGSAKGGIVGGGGLNLDLVALISGAKNVTILAKQFNAVLGVGCMYSAVHGKPGGYILGNLNFAF